METTKPTNGQPCCEILTKMDLGWFNLGEEKVMPYIYEKDSSTMYRVNHCPSCGKYIRDISLRQSPVNKISPEIQKK